MGKVFAMNGLTRVFSIRKSIFLLLKADNIRSSMLVQVPTEDILLEVIIRIPTQTQSDILKG